MKPKRIVAVGGVAGGASTAALVLVVPAPARE